MQAAKRDAPQCRLLQAARDKGVRQNRPVPPGCCEKLVLTRPSYALAISAVLQKPRNGSASIKVASWLEIGAL